MILDEETKEKFGYLASSLSNGSKKRILVQCDYCLETYDAQNKNIIVGRDKLQKDACMKCRFKKREECNLLNYGVKQPSQLSEIKEKIKDTFQKNYGVDAYVTTEEFKEKSRKTHMEKYGVEHIMESEEHKEKLKGILLERYGVENVFQLEEVREKAKETCKEKYGGGYGRTQEYKDRMIEKFGVENNFQREEIKEKSKQTMIEKYGVDSLMKIPEFAKMIQEKSIKTKLEKGMIKIHEGKTIEEWAKQIGFSRSHFNGLVNKFGWDIAVSMTPKMSSLELRMKNILDRNNIEYEQQFRVERKFADFRVGNVLIECDGLYFHSELFKEKNYHKEKRELYIEHGFSPLFFREDEIRDKEHIVESIILNKLGRSERIFARKCEVVELDNNESNEFLEENHLMGKGRGKTLGLKYNGHIVSVMRICLRRKDKGEYEVSRFCNKAYKSVIGGYSKLLKAFGKFPKLFSFTDLRYGTGEHLENLGFSKIGGDTSFKWTDGNISYHRMKFPNSSGFDHDLFRIHDCGQLKHELVS